VKIDDYFENLTLSISNQFLSKGIVFSVHCFLLLEKILVLKKKSAAVPGNSGQHQYIYVI
jgi:hypothetical protein